MEIENLQKGQLIFHTGNTTLNTYARQGKNKQKETGGEEEGPGEKRSRPSAKGERKFPTQQQVELC